MKADEEKQLFKYIRRLLEEDKMKINENNIKCVKQKCDALEYNKKKNGRSSDDDDESFCL
ncbi:hypothetical protein HHI36_001699, partial [Cryptolaemus montrouzieri]